ATDFADHDDAFRLPIVLEQPQAVDEIESVDRITADADHCGLAQPDIGGLEYRFVGERARTRNNGDRTRHVDVPGHDADLALAGRDDARTVRADQHGVGIFLQHILDAQHVQYRNAFGDRDDHAHAGLGGFENRVGRERRRHEDHGGIRAGVVHRILHGVVDRQTDVLAAALAGRHTANQPGAVIERLFGMERALLAGKALANDFGVFVDEYGHGNS